MWELKGLLTNLKDNKIRKRCDFEKWMTDKKVLYEQKKVFVVFQIVMISKKIISYHRKAKEFS